MGAGGGGGGGGAAVAGPLLGSWSAAAGLIGWAAIAACFINTDCLFISSPGFLKWILCVSNALWSIYDWFSLQIRNVKWLDIIRAAIYSTYTDSCVLALNIGVQLVKSALEGLKGSSTACTVTRVPASQGCNPSYQRQCSVARLTWQYGTWLGLAAARVQRGSRSSRSRRSSRQGGGGQDNVVPPSIILLLLGTGIDISVVRSPARPSWRLIRLRFPGPQQQMTKADASVALVAGAAG